MNSSNEDPTVAWIVKCLLNHSRRGITCDRSTLLSDLECDSLDLIEGLFELEQHFGVTLSNTELAELSTLGDLVQSFTPATSKR